ncbi:MAG TPA: hypothetical protein VM076_09935 [Gemmatimonadaceae bacterium]|nr:hypothetical protein [Gemmatimonadaceae bacterium]
MSRSRIFQLSVLAVVLVFAGAKAVGYVEERRRSPFVLWEFRPGGLFSALEKSAFRQTKQRFTCNPVVGDARLCEMRVTGIEGLIRTLVDGRGRVTVVQFLPDSASPPMREESRRVAAEWNRIRSGVSDASGTPGSESAVTRWRSVDGKWGALMRYGRHGSTPTLVTLTDATSLAAVSSSTPLASVALALNQLAEDRDLPVDGDVTAVIGDIMYGRATDGTHQTPVPRASTSAPALCEPERLDPVLLAKPGSLDEFSAPTLALLEKAIPAVYPGSQLALGDGMWIVDSDGRTERVRLKRSESADTPQDGVVYAVQFPGRLAVAQQRLEDGVPDQYCRAPAELLFARANEDGSLAEANRIAVDQEAIASEISTISLFEPGSVSAEPQARVRYTALYASAQSTGSMEWEAIILDDPPRTTGRVPLLFEQHARGESEAKGGYVVVTGRPAGGIELSTLEQYKWGFMTRTFVVPVDASGVLLGAKILDRPF